MQKGHNEKPIRQAGEIPNPEEGIKDSGLEGRQMGRAAGNGGVPKGDIALPPAFDVEPFFREDIFQGIHEGRKMAPKPGSPIKKQPPEAGP